MSWQQLSSRFAVNQTVPGTLDQLAALGDGHKQILKKPLN